MLKDTLAVLLPPHNVSINSLYTTASAGVSALSSASVSINYTVTFADTLLVGYSSALAAYNATSYSLYADVQSGYFTSVYLSGAFAYGATSLYGVVAEPSAYSEMFSAPAIEALGGGGDDGGYQWRTNIVIAIVIVGLLLVAGSVTMALRSFGCLPSSEG